jgi:hypothetical protein
VKRGLRAVRGGAVDLIEKLGRKDLCPCNSRRLFQEMLHEIRPPSMARNGNTIFVKSEERLAKGAARR